MTDLTVFQSHRNFQIIDSLMNISTNSSRAVLVEKAGGEAAACLDGTRGHCEQDDDHDVTADYDRLVDRAENRAAEEYTDEDDDWLANRWTDYPHHEAHHSHPHHYNDEQVNTAYRIHGNRTSTPHRHRALSAWDREFAALDRDLSQDDRNRFAWEPEDANQRNTNRVLPWDSDRRGAAVTDKSTGAGSKVVDNGRGDGCDHRHTTDQQYPADLQGDPAWDRDDQVNWDGERLYSSSPLRLASALPNVRLEYGTRSVAIDNDSDVRTKMAGRATRLFSEHPRLFLAVACWCAMVQSMVFGGLINVNISTMQQRFGWSSTTSGMLPSIFDLCGLPVAIFVGYLGNNANKPRCISIGMVLVAAGAVMHSLPHFLSSNYTPTSNGTIDNSVCQLDSQNTGANEMCIPDKDNVYMGLFVMSMVVMGVGSVPLFTQGLTYFDDIVSRDTAAMFSGVFFSFSIIGSTLGFILGGVMLSFNTDFEKGIASKVDIKDSRFVGAWWFLFLVCAGAALIGAIPMFFFPKQMKGSLIIKENRKNEVHANSAKEFQNIKEDMSTMKTTICVIKLLLYNGSFVGNTLTAVAEMSIIIGLSIFGAKYAENQFSISRTSAGLLLGIIAIPGGIGGSLFGSFLIKKLEIDCKRLLKYQFFGTLVCLLPATMFLLRCEQAPFVGITSRIQYHKGVEITPRDLLYNCNSNCSCGTLNFDPVCGADGYSYFSSCHAGCLGVKSNDGIEEYTNCRCLSGSPNASSLSASTQNSNNSSFFQYDDDQLVSSTKGLCRKNECFVFWIYSVINLAAIFFIYSIAMFHYSIILRVVPCEQRDIAIGMDMVVTRLLGTIPAPILFGTVIDITCLLWTKECQDKRGACLYYDNTHIAWYLMAICTTYQVIACLAAFCSWKLYRADLGADNYTQSSPMDSLRFSDNAKLDHVATEINQAFTHD